MGPMGLSSKLQYLMLGTPQGQREELARGSQKPLVSFGGGEGRQTSAFLVFRFGFRFESRVSFPFLRPLEETKKQGTESW